MSTECEICKTNPATGGRAVFRTAPKGVIPARWRCEKCLTPEQKKAIDPETSRIVRVIDPRK